MTDHFVRPDVRAFLDYLNNHPAPKLHEVDPIRAREMARVMSQLADVPVGEIAVVRDLSMPGPHGGDIPLRLFDAQEHRLPGPALVFFHGGGWVLGDLDSYAPLCAEIARVLDIPVISVGYRLAPEHRWPAGPDDAEASARWIAENGVALGRAITGLVLAGDSAGGALTITTALALRDRPAALPLLAQWPIYPAVDSSGRYPSIDTFGENYLLTKDSMRWFNEHYQPGLGDWRASPILADQRGLPATLVLAAGLDPLLDQGRAYAAKTIAAGVPTTYREAAGTIHGFLTLRKAMPSGESDLRAALIVLKSMIREAEADRVMAQAAHGPAPVQTA